MIRYLLDTNIPSELRKPKPAPEVEAWVALYPPSQQAISVITLGEFTKGIEQHADPIQAANLKSWLDFTLRSLFVDRILPVTSPIAERAGAYIGQHQKSGRQITLADAIIAATAVEHNLTLVTRNMKDFKFINVPMINPWPPPDPIQ